MNLFRWIKGQRIWSFYRQGRLGWLHEKENPPVDNKVDFTL